MITSLKREYQRAKKNIMLQIAIDPDTQAGLKSSKSFSFTGLDTLKPCHGCRQHRCDQVRACNVLSGL